MYEIRCKWVLCVFVFLHILWILWLNILYFFCFFVGQTIVQQILLWENICCVDDGLNRFLECIRFNFRHLSDIVLMLFLLWLLLSLSWSKILPATSSIGKKLLFAWNKQTNGLHLHFPSLEETRWMVMIRPVAYHNHLQHTSDPEVTCIPLKYLNCIVSH